MDSDSGMLVVQGIPKQLISCFPYQEHLEYPMFSRIQKIVWIPEITAMVQEFETIPDNESLEWVLRMQNKKHFWSEKVKDYNKECCEAMNSWKNEIPSRLETEKELLDYTKGSSEKNTYIDRTSGQIYRSNCKENSIF